MKTVKFKQFALALALCALAANAFAGGSISICVSNANDAGDGSLRTAITQANDAGGGAITFCITNCITNTITLLSPLPSLTNITITGLGTNAITVSGNNQFPVFSVAAGSTNLLSGLTIADGVITANQEFVILNGGAGVSNAGSLTLLDCAITNCLALASSSTLTRK